jgi:lipoyl(octanoyl) transferase
MIVTDLGTMPYRDAWARQEQVHAGVVAGDEEHLLLVEHPPVVTLGRRAGVDRNLLATPEALAAAGVELVQSDRGGDITFHGPGQVVAYPVVRLNDHRLSVGGYVRALESAVIAALADLGVPACREDGAVGVWAGGPTPPVGGTSANGGESAACSAPGKLCAIGVRIRRGTSLHGVALNVTTDLNYFNLIVPCGLAGRPVTSVQRLLGPEAPGIDVARRTLAGRLVAAFAGPRELVGAPT